MQNKELHSKKTRTKNEEQKKNKDTNKEQKDTNKELLSKKTRTKNKKNEEPKNEEQKTNTRTKNKKTQTKNSTPMWQALMESPTHTLSTPHAIRVLTDIFNFSLTTSPTSGYSPKSYLF